MMFEQDGLVLAAERRKRIFDKLPDDVGAIIACQPVNKGYLSGYFSMTHDTDPFYRSAAIATRDGAVRLVVSAADAGPALEWLGDPAALFRYGTFFFETAADHPELDFGRPSAEGFEAALAHALQSVAGGGGKIAIDARNVCDLGLGDNLNGISADRFICASDALVQARRIKLLGDIERIRHATRLVERGFAVVRDKLVTGATEAEIAAMISAEMTSGGATPHFVSVTSGPRSALADAYPTHRAIGPGELLRIDAGCAVEGFCSDMARTFVIGEPDDKARRYYAAIAEGLEAELRCIKAGVEAELLFETAVETVKKAGIPGYRRHHCGHGLGIGGYEDPIIAAGVGSKLEAGLCLCVETPYYELGWGGMMVEDTVIVTENGYEPLSTLSRELIVT